MGHNSVVTCILTLSSSTVKHNWCLESSSQHPGKPTRSKHSRAQIRRYGYDFRRHSELPTAVSAPNQEVTHYKLCLGMSVILCDFNLNVQYPPVLSNVVCWICFPICTLLYTILHIIIYYIRLWGPSFMDYIHLWRIILHNTNRTVKQTATAKCKGQNVTVYSVHSILI